MHIIGPAGNFEKLKAAIKAGADEVYFGLKGFGARRNNDNLGFSELLDAIDYAHLHGVKCLLTLNTVMKDIELKNVINNLIPIYEHGIDAVIVQDLGLISILKENFKDLTIHGSTQMTVSNHVEANFLKSIGLSRVVLARELSFEEIKSIREKTDIELEVFVSGSMCISYSGNCYVSSFIGGRSGNRGMCAYTCRKNFKQSDGKLCYTLSPNDQLLEYNEIEKLQSIGINAIKVEGRKKNENYVFETVSYYKDILNGVKRKSQSYKLFNRGYSKGYFYLDNNLMNTKYPSNFGYLLGVNKDGKILLNDDIENGDGIQFVNSNFKTISGIFVNKIIKNGKKVTKAFKGDVITLEVPNNTLFIYKNYSKSLNDKISNLIATTKRYLKIDARLTATKGYPLTLSLKYKNILATVSGDILNEECKKQIHLETIKEKISELGDTTFKLNNIEINYDNISFFPFSELKNLKRLACKKMEELIIDSYKKNTPIINLKSYPKNCTKMPYIFSCLVSNSEQEKACRDFGINKIYYASYDISKEKNLDKLKIDNNLAYNFEQLCMGEKYNIKKSINWNFNIFNNYSLDFLTRFKNVDTVFLSPELSYKQLRHLTSTSLKKGLVIYGHLKAMYIEHDLLKTNYMQIQGEFYDRYILKRNKLNNVELYLYKPMNLIPKLDLIEELGLSELRLDFTFETYEEVIKILKSIKKREGNYNPYAFQMGVS